MAEASKVRISLVQQIFDEMFSKIMEQEEFNQDVIDNLEQLAANGDLKKPQKVANAIKLLSKDGYETA